MVTGGSVVLLTSVAGCALHHRRGPQRLLAATVTALIHGTEAASNAEAASQALFGGTDLRGISAAHLRDMFRVSPQPRGVREWRCWCTASGTRIVYLEPMRFRPVEL